MEDFIDSLNIIGNGEKCYIKYRKKIIEKGKDNLLKELNNVGIIFGLIDDAIDSLFKKKRFS